MARKIERIVWHTAAHGRDGQAFDTTTAQIDQWHRERGWSKIGYNVVIRFDGTTKTCPGRLVDMNLARLLIRQRLTPTSAPTYTYDSQAAGELLQGLQQVYGAAARLKLPEEVMYFLNQFRKQPEVDDAIKRWRQEQGD